MEEAPMDLDEEHGVSGDEGYGTSEESRSRHVEFSFDEDKLQNLKELFPPNLALAPLLKRWERASIMKRIPFFPDGFLPQALKDDISGLSGALSPTEKKMINILCQCQEKARWKLRVILYNMYKYMDPEQDLSEQSSLFKEHHKLFMLELDDFIFYIKEQQKIILSKHGLEAAIGLKDRSIIPPEMKDELQKVVDWREAVPVRRFSGRGGWRGGSRSPRGRGSHRGGRRGGRGWRGGKGSSRRSSYGGGHGDGYRSGGSEGASRKNSFASFGKGRGRGGSSRGGQS